MSKQKRRWFNGDEKIRILKRRLVEGTPISQVCEEYSISPTQFYHWQKQIFESGASVFDTSKPRPSRFDRRDRDQELESKLAQQNEVLSEVVEALIAAKKVSGDR